MSEHECTSACETTCDPWAPVVHREPDPRGSAGWRRHATPLEVREYELGCELARLILANQDVLAPLLLRLLAEPIGRLVAVCVAERTGGRDGR